MQQPPTHTVSLGHLIPCPTFALTFTVPSHPGLWTAFCSHTRLISPLHPREVRQHAGRATHMPGTHCLFNLYTDYSPYTLHLTHTFYTHATQYTFHTSLIHSLLLTNSGFASRTVARTRPARITPHATPRLRFRHLRIYHCAPLSVPAGSAATILWMHSLTRLILPARKTCLYYHLQLLRRNLNLHAFLGIAIARASRIPTGTNI